MKSKRNQQRSTTAVLLVAILLLMLGILAIVAPVATAGNGFAVYSEYVPGNSVYGVDGYGDLLYYDDGTGVAHIVRVSIPDGADPNSPVARTFTEIGTHDFKGDIGWSGGQYGEFYVDKDYIYYGPGINGKGGIEKWTKKSDGTFGAYQGRLNIPVLNKGTTLAYDAINNMWYTCTSSRAVYSFKAGDTAWKYEFTYPTYGTGQGNHGGMEFVGGYLWVSETNTDVIGQWQKTGTGNYNGWDEVNPFNYSYPKAVRGLGFGPLGHFWASSGSGTTKIKPSIYELGGGQFQVNADFTWPPEPQKEGSEVIFTDTSTSWPDTIASWNWDFGDGGTSSEQNPPSHTYGDNGTYEVSLTVTNSNGLQSTISQNVTIVNVAPADVILAASPATINENDSTTLSGSFTDPGTLDTHTVVIDWGDGSSDTPLNLAANVLTFSASHVYGDNGAYTINVTVTDKDLASGSGSTPVVVNNMVPVIDPQTSSSYSGNEGSPITFTATAMDEGSDDLTFTWDWGDGTLATATAYFNNGVSPDPRPSSLGTYPFSASNKVQHTYGDNGTYTVTLTVTDDDGGAVTRTVTVMVNNVAPVVDAGPDQAAHEGESVSLSASFTDPGWLDTHIATIDWGDGTIETGVVAQAGVSGTVTGSHAYAHSGTYSITVTVTDDDRATGRDTVIVYIPLGLTVSVAPGELPSPSDAQAVPLRDIPLRDIPLRDIPLRDIPLRDISIMDSPLRDIPLRDISVDWGALLAGTSLEGADLSTITLEDLYLAGILLPDVTLAAIPLRDIPLRDIPLRDIPWEAIPLRDIPVQNILTSQNSVTYTITVANYGNVDAESVVITYTLPDDFVYMIDSTTGATTANPVIQGQNLSWGLPPMPAFTVPANSVLTLSFRATAPLSLGTYFSDVSATSNLDFPPAVDAAPVVITDTFEPNDTWEQAQEIAPDLLYLSYISTDTDTDWYKMPVPLAKGTVVTVYLSHLPADYDLVLLAGTEMSTTDIPLRDIPLRDIPLRDIPLRDIPLRDIPLRDIPLRDITLQDIPLRDIPLRDIPLRDISMERGTTDEIVTNRVINQTGDYYILVFGYNGAHSNEPYVLRVKVTPPPSIDVAPRSLPSPGPAGTPYEPYGADAETIIVTNQQRLEQYYGQDAIYGASGLRAELETFADLDSVKGLIVPVDSYESVRNAYTAWDANPGDVDAANTVAGAIKAVIIDTLNTHPNVRYMVIVGSDEILPFRRVPDEVYLSNEAAYASRARLQPSALYASLLQGYILTDDYYADMTPVPWRGRELYVPDYAIGRLVETPGEIAALLQQFATNNGVLEVSSALVTAYDFLTDGGTSIVDALRSQGVDTGLLINEVWTTADLASHLLGSLAHELNSINAHFNHWALGPPVGSLFFSNQIQLSYLEGKLVFSMGCHSGLNVDDFVSLPGDWSLDWPQAFAQKAAWFIGNTGYGYGDTDIVALSEDLMQKFAQALGAEASMPVGQALIQAKQGYFLSMGGYGPFDEKVMIEATLYGLPMYQVMMVADASPQQAGALSQQEEDTLLVIEANRLVNFVPVDPPLTAEAQLVARTIADGQFYSADGETQFTPYRPVQPRTSLGVDYPGQVAHGALFTGGTYQDILEFDPVIARPVDDQTFSQYEPQIVNEAWYPSKLQTILSLQTISGAVQRLVVIPGQFITTSSGTAVIGTERLYTSLTYDIYYSTSQDYTAPIIELTDVTIRGNTGNFTAYFSVMASDPDDPAIPDDGRVRRVVATWSYATGDTAWRRINLQYKPTSGTWTGELAGLTGTDIDVIVQAVDAAGNVGSSTSKGFFFTPIPVEAGDDQTVNEGNTVAFQGTIDVVLESAAILWDFGDGSTARDVLNPSHVYGDNGVYTVTLRVTDGKGGSGWDTLKVTVNNVDPLVEVAEELTVLYTDPLQLSGSFIDPGLRDTHTYRWDIRADPAGNPIITIWGNLAVTIDWLNWGLDYLLPGTYTATLTVMDDDGGVGLGTTQVIIKANTSTALTSSDNPSILGQAVTFTATVSVVDPGTGSPTGTVQFKDNGTNLGSPVTLSGGQATYTTAVLSVGAHSITAEYSGDGNFNGSSGSLSQTVIYNFSGFLSPIPDSQYQMGRTIPVKFALTDFNGVSIGTAVAKLSVDGGLTYPWDVGYNSTSGQYHFNLDTSGLPLGPLTITVSLDDWTPPDGWTPSRSVTVELK